MLADVPQVVIAALAGVIGLLFGSFLNVVIYRVPKMMERQWQAECAELSGNVTQPAEQPAFNLLVPRSRCSSCGHAITWYENIPLLSYLVLRGKCSACGVAYGIRYHLSNWLPAFTLLFVPGAGAQA